MNELGSTLGVVVEIDQDEPRCMPRRVVESAQAFEQAWLAVRAMNRAYMGADEMQEPLEDGLVNDSFGGPMDGQAHVSP